MVADLDEKLSDCGPRDVEGGSPHSSPGASEGEEEREGGPSLLSTSSHHSTSFHHSTTTPYTASSLPSASTSRSSRSPEPLGAGGRKNLFLAGISEVSSGCTLDWRFCSINAPCHLLT